MIPPLERFAAPGRIEVPGMGHDLPPGVCDIMAKMSWYIGISARCRADDREMGKEKQT